MVRNYKRKTTKGSYNNEDLQEAVLAVQKGTLSGYKAAQIYKIPRMTIMDHVHNKRSSNKLGRKTTLSLDVEQKIASCLHTMEKYGFGLSRTEVAELIGKYINQNNLNTCFKNGIPGKDWLFSFQKRHNLAVKKPQTIEYARKTGIDPFVVNEYFELLKNTIAQLGLQGKPHAIWNLDETSFSKDPLKTKILGLKGHAATRVISTPGKDNTTVLLGASAAGEKTPPLIVFKGKYVWDQWTSPDAYPGTTYAATQNGWMETDVFEAFFKKSFLPTVGDQRPILLIYDGHSTHLGLNIIETARKENITILKLPPHSSHVLQLLDISVMKPFKDRWDIALVKWQRLNIGVQLPKKEFSRLIGEIWAQIEPQILCNGFRKAGIHPFNPRVVEGSKFDPLKLSRWKEQMSNQGANCTDITPQTLIKIVLSFINKKYIATECQTEERIPNLINTHVDLTQATIKKTVTFESLLLEKVKRGENFTKIRRTRVAPGAEVITHNDVEKSKLKRQINITKQSRHSKRTRNDDVVMLNKNLKSNTEMQPFAVKRYEDLPSCLQDKNKIIILSDIILNKPASPVNSSLFTQPGPSGIRKGTVNRKKGTTNNVASSIKISNINKISMKTRKGKGIGKKSTGKENQVPSPQIDMFTKNQKSRISTSSTTSVSGSISCHSDSDIEHIASDYELPDDYDSAFIDKMLLSSDLGTAKDIKQNSNLTTTKAEANETDNTLSTSKTENYSMATAENVPNENFYINDYVLVRYYGKKWTYFVGVVEAILADELTKEPFYSISFFKTVKKPKLMFKVPKKIDRDEVPVISIVKKVNLSRDLENINNYFLCNQDDSIYFI